MLSYCRIFQLRKSIFYETVHGNFVAIINEEKSFNSKKDEELNIKYLSYLTNSGKYTDPDEPLALQVDISTLSKPVKKILYKYDCDVTPMCENQLEYFEEIEFFHRLWGMEQIESPLLVTPKADPSPTVSPWLDEPDSTTATRTPEATVSNQMENLTPSLCLAPKKKRKITTLEKAQDYLDLIYFY